MGCRCLLLPLLVAGLYCFYELTAGYVNLGDSECKDYDSNNDEKEENENGKEERG